LEEVGQWVELESWVVHPETSTITAPISHFSAFTILIHTHPATFTVSDLFIAPAEADIGEIINIVILVINTGSQSGSYEVTLKINGIVEASKQATLTAGGSKLVSFSTIKNTAGAYSLEVDGLSGSFAVKERPAASLWGGVIAALVAVAVAVAVATIGLIHLLLYKQRK